jgi:hypothetical protein
MNTRDNNGNVERWPTTTADGNSHHINEDHLPDELSDLDEHPHRSRNRRAAVLPDDGEQSQATTLGSTT